MNPNSFSLSRQHGRTQNGAHYVHEAVERAVEAETAAGKTAKAAAKYWRIEGRLYAFDQRALISACQICILLFPFKHLIILINPGQIILIPISCVEGLCLTKFGNIDFLNGSLNDQMDLKDRVF